MEICKKVAAAHGAPTSPTPLHERKKPLHKPSRGEVACPLLVNPFHSPGEMTAAKFNTLLREAERRHDVSIKLRVEWIRQAQDCMATTERQKMQAKMAIQRVKRQSKRPKYPVFFSIQPLIKMAFETRNSPPQKSSWTH
jgi:hypothetical protein